MESLGPALKKPAASASTRPARTTVKLEEAAREERLVPALKKPAASTSARCARAVAEPLEDAQDCAEEQLVAAAKKPAARRARPPPADEAAPLAGVNVVTTVKSLPVRSYVQGMTSSPNTGRRLICEFSATHHKDHKVLAEAVARRIASEKLSYRQARALKSTILKEAEEKTSKISAAAA